MREYQYKAEEIPVSENSKRKILISRPIIPVILIKNQRLVGYEALLDSGADYNVFHSEIAEILGINLTRGKSRKIYGLGGQHIKGYVHKVELRLQGFSSFKSEVVFSKQIPEHAVGVLGNSGFFDHYEVTFDYDNKSIKIENSHSN
ncbi:aspartyl protease family protein [Candidatus Woesebacteria bacterium]|nr:aspartyl protease family protein [Candidatus Woesebacteria bacterium]